MNNKGFSKRGVLFLAAVAALICIFIAAGLGIYLVRPADRSGAGQVYLVPVGASMKEIAQGLEEVGIISHRRPFLLWARITGKSRKIKSGEYSLSPSMPPAKILEILSRGEIRMHSVTIPEGLTMVQIAQIVEKAGLAGKDEFLAAANAAGTAARHGIASDTLEGYLYPDTYHFAKGIPAEKIVEAMLERFLEVMTPLRSRAVEKGMTVNEVVTLASIVEKETGLAAERPLIASVFLNRLRKNMRLESDPTVIYGIKDFNGNLTRKDLSRPGPYNTYMIKGLPPAPIASPGKDAIKAVLYPAETDFIFFVSRNNGSHYFSRTLREHNTAVRKYQKKGKGRVSGRGAGQS